MQFTITARHLQVPPWLTEMVRSKVEKLERFGHKLISLHAIFGREKYLYTTELTLTAKGLTLVGKASDRRDLLTCAESALEKLKNQLHRRESKRIERRRFRSHRPSF